MIGVIFQAPSLIPSLDVVQNVALPLVLGGQHQRPAEIQALAALNRLGLAGFAPKLPGELSGGQAQRVAIARVIAMRPTLILADEATGQLDQRSGQHVIEVLIDAADQLDAALVISTHDEAIAARLPERWDMRDGVLNLSSRKNGGSK
jgi:putative ABC transport system ATP-binding protein